MVKVLHISARADIGGGPKHIQYLIDVLKENTDCFIACPNEKPFYDIFCNQVGYDKVTVIPHRSFKIKAALYLVRFIKEHNIEIIHCHGKGASVYGKFIKLILKSRIKLIYTTHGLHFDNYNKIFNLLNLIYEKATGFFIDKIIYVSENESYKAKKHNVFSHIPSIVIPNGVPTPLDITTTDTVALKNNLFPGRSGKPIIITLSRFDFQKNMSECFDIAVQCKEYNFLWVGDGPDFNTIKNKIKEERIENIKLYGKTNDVLTLLQLSDLYLSTARWEGMPLSLLEALSVGLPIVASDVVGNNDIVNNVIVGRLYQLGNIKQAKDRLTELLNNNNKSQINDYFKSHYSSEIMGKKVALCYINTLL